MAFNLTAQLNIALNSASLRAASNQLNTALNSNTQVKLGIDRNSSSGLKQIKSQIDESTNAMESFGKQSGLAAKRFAAFSVTAGAFIAFTAAAKEAVSAAIDFDFQMVKLGQVSSSSGNEIKNVASEITRLATNYGVSSKELGTVAITLKQANLSLADTKIALESLAQAALAPNFENLKDTTEGAIAIMNQFKIEAKDLGAALGSVNAVAGEFAVEAGDIIEAIRKTGGAFKAAGGNLNELIALFTSVRQTTRESAESISTGLRTIFTRIQRNDTVEALRAVNIQLRYTSDEARALGDAKLENQFVGPYEAVKRLSAGLKGLQSTDPRFSAIVEQLGGYRQISKVIPLINEFATAQKALGIAQAGSTSLSINAGQAQDALIIKFQKLKETFLEVGRNIVNSPGFRGLVDTFISASSSVLGLIDSLKGLLPLITALAAVKLFQGAASFTKGFLSAGSDKKDKKAEGGFLRMRTGGIVPGSGSGDKVPALLEPGELVVPRNQVRRNKYGIGGLAEIDINNFKESQGAVVEATGKNRLAEPRNKQVFPQGTPIVYGDYIFKKNGKAQTAKKDISIKDSQVQVYSIDEGHIKRLDKKESDITDAEGYTKFQEDIKAAKTARDYYFGKGKTVSNDDEHIENRNKLQKFLKKNAKGLKIDLTRENDISTVAGIFKTDSIDYPSSQKGAKRGYILEPYISQITKSNSQPAGARFDFPNFTQKKATLLGIKEYNTKDKYVDAKNKGSSDAVSSILKKELGTIFFQKKIITELDNIDAIEDSKNSNKVIGREIKNLKKEKANEKKGYRPQSETETENDYINAIHETLRKKPIQKRNKKSVDQLNELASLRGFKFQKLAFGGSVNRQRFMEGKYVGPKPLHPDLSAQEILGMAKGYKPNEQEVKKGFGRASLIHHPDRGGSNYNMGRVNSSYNYLKGGSITDWEKSVKAARTSYVDELKGMGQDKEAADFESTIPVRGKNKAKSQQSTKTTGATPEAEPKQDPNLNNYADESFAQMNARTGNSSSKARREWQFATPDAFTTPNRFDSFEAVRNASQFREKEEKSKTINASSAYSDRLKAAKAKRGGYFEGGPIIRMKKGGIVPGSGSGDKVRALLEPGELVVPKHQVARQKFGEGGGPRRLSVNEKSLLLGFSLGVVGGMVPFTAGLFGMESIIGNEADFGPFMGYAAGMIGGSTAAGIGVGALGNLAGKKIFSSPKQIEEKKQAKKLEAESKIRKQYEKRNIADRSSILLPSGGEEGSNIPKSFVTTKELSRSRSPDSGRTLTGLDSNETYDARKSIEAKEERRKKKFAEKYLGIKKEKGIFGGIRDKLSKLNPLNLLKPNLKKDPKTGKLISDTKEFQEFQYERQVKRGNREYQNRLGYALGERKDEPTANPVVSAPIAKAGISEQEALDAWGKIDREGLENPKVQSALAAWAKIDDEDIASPEAKSALAAWTKVYIEEPEGPNYSERLNEARAVLNKAKSESQGPNWLNRKNEASRILQEEKAKARGPNWQERKDEARRILDQIRKTGKPFVPEATAKPVVSAPVPVPKPTATATAPIPTAKPVVSAPVSKPTATATAPIPNKPEPNKKVYTNEEILAAMRKFEKESASGKYDAKIINGKMVYEDVQLPPEIASLEEGSTLFNADYDKDDIQAFERFGSASIERRKGGRPNTFHNPVIRFNNANGRARGSSPSSSTISNILSRGPTDKIFTAEEAEAETKRWLDIKKAEKEAATAKPVVSAPVQKPTATATATAPIPNKPAATAKPVVSAPVSKPTSTATEPIPTAKPKPTAKPVVKPKNLEEFTNALNPKQLADFKQKIKTAKEIIVNARTSGSMKLKSVGFNFLGTKFNVTANKDLADKGTTKPTEEKPTYDLKGVKSLDELLSKLPPKHSEDLRAKIGRGQDKFLETKNIKDLNFAYDFGDKRGPLNIQIEKDVIKFGTIGTFPWKPKTPKEKRTEQLRVATERNAKKKANNMARTASTVDAAKAKTDNASSLTDIISGIDQENQQAKTFGIASDTKVFEGSEQYKELQKKLAAVRETRRMDETQSLVGSTDYNMGDISKGLSPSVYNLGYENKNLGRYKIEDALNRVKEDELVNPKEQLSLDNPLQDKIFQRSQLRRSERSQAEKPIGINENYKAPQEQQQKDIIGTSPQAQRLRMQMQEKEFENPIIGIAENQKTKKEPRVKKTEAERYKLSRKQSTPAQEKTLFDEMELAKIGTYGTQEERIKNDAEKAKRFKDAASESARVKFNLNPRQQRRAIANENLADNLMSLRSKGTGKPVVSQAQAVAPAAPIPTPAPIVNNADTENVILKALAGKQSDFWKTIRQTTTDNNAVTKALQSLQAQGKIVSDSNRIGFYLLAGKNKKSATPLVSEPATTSTTQEKPQIPEDSYNEFSSLVKKPRKPRATKKTGAPKSEQSNFYNTQESEYQKLLDSINAQSRSKKGRRFASGGLVPGTGNSDTVPMDLPENSFVIRKSSVNKIGAANLAKQARFASGGTVPALVTPGEYIYTPEEAKKIGSSKLHSMNKYAKFARGGPIGLGRSGKFDPNDPNDIKKLKETLEEQLRYENPLKDENTVQIEVQQNTDEIQKRSKQYTVDETARQQAETTVNTRNALVTRKTADVAATQQNVNAAAGNVASATTARDSYIDEANTQRGLVSSNRQEATRQQARITSLTAAGASATDPRLIAANNALIAATTAESTARALQARATRNAISANNQVIANTNALNAAVIVHTQQQGHLTRAQNAATTAVQGLEAATLKAEGSAQLLDEYQQDAAGKVLLAGKVIGETKPLSGRGSMENALKFKEKDYEKQTGRKVGKDERETLKSNVLSEYRASAEKQIRAKAVKTGKPITELNIQATADQYTREFSEGKRKAIYNKQGEVTGDKSLGNEISTRDEKRSRFGPDYTSEGNLTLKGRGKDFLSRAAFGAKRTDFEAGTEGDQQFKQSRGQTVANKLIGGAALGGFVSDKISKSAGRPEDFITPSGGGSVPPDPSKEAAYKSTMAFSGALTKGTTYAAAAGQALAQYGPIVAGIGAGVAGLVGAIQGYADALEEAEKAIREQKIAVGLKNLEDIYASVASGLVEVNDATIKNIQSNQEDIQKNKSQQLLADSGGNTSTTSSVLNTLSFGTLGSAGYDPKKYSASVSKSEKEDDARAVTQSTMVLNKLSSTLGKDSAKQLKASGKDITATSFEDQKPELLKKLRDENSGFGKSEIRKIASTQNISIPDAEKQFLAAMKDAFESEKAKEVSLKQIETNNKTIASMALLSGAVNAAAAAADSFNERLSLNDSLFEGNAGSTKITSQSDKIGMSGSNPNFSQFNSAISESSGLLGDYGQSFKAQGNAVNTASQILPEILANSAANPVSGKDPSAQIVDALRAGLKERGITGPEADKVVNSVGGKVSAEEFTKQLAEAGGDVGKATEKLLSDIKDPLVAAFKDIDAKLTEQSQAYISGLENLAKRQNQILQEFDKLSGLKSQQSSFRASEAQRSPNAKYGAEESKALDVARNTQAEKQMRLTGLGSGGSQDSGIIAAKLKEAEKRAEKQSLSLEQTPKDKQSGSAFRDAALELTKTKNEAANLKTALKNLTDQSGLLQAAQQKLASVRSGIDEKRGFGRKLLTQTPEDQDKMLRGQQIFNQVKAQGGSLQGMSTEENAVLFDFLDNFGSAGKKIQEQILDANGYGASQDDLSEEKALVALHDRLYQEQINAQQLYIVSQQGLQNEYFTKLEDKNKTFYSNLEKFTQELTKNEKSVEKNKEQQKLTKIEDVQKNAKPLSDVGIKTKEDFDLLSQNKGKVQDLANTKMERQDLKRVSGEKLDTKIERNAQGNVSNLPAIRNSLTNAGYKGPEIDEIAGKIAESKDSGAANDDKILQEARDSVGAKSEKRLEKKEAKQTSDLGGNEKLIGVSNNLASGSISSETMNRALDNIKELNLGTGDLGVSAEAARANIKRLETEISNLGGTQVGIQQVPAAAPQKPVGLALATGGSVFSPRGTDTVPAMLTPGEFVVNKNATQQNLPLLKSINSGETSYLSGGGQVGYYGEGGQPTTLTNISGRARQYKIPVLPNITDYLQSTLDIGNSPEILEKTRQLESLKEQQQQLSEEKEFHKKSKIDETLPIVAGAKASLDNLYSAGKGLIVNDKDVTFAGSIFGSKNRNLINTALMRMGGFGAIAGPYSGMSSFLNQAIQFMQKEGNENYKAKTNSEVGGQFNDKLKDADTIDKKYSLFDYIEKNLTRQYNTEINPQGRDMPISKEREQGILENKSGLQNLGNIAVAAGTETLLAVGTGGVGSGIKAGVMGGARATVLALKTADKAARAAARVGSRALRASDTTGSVYAKYKKLKEIEKLRKLSPAQRKASKLVGPQAPADIMAARAGETAGNPAFRSAAETGTFGILGEPAAAATTTATTAAAEAAATTGQRGIGTILSQNLGAAAQGTYNAGAATVGGIKKAGMAVGRNSGTIVRGSILPSAEYLVNSSEKAKQEKERQAREKNGNKSPEALQTDELTNSSIMAENYKNILNKKESVSDKQSKNKKVFNSGLASTVGMNTIGVDNQEQEWQGSESFLQTQRLHDVLTSKLEYDEVAPDSGYNLITLMNDEFKSFSTIEGDTSAKTKKINEEIEAIKLAIREKQTKDSMASAEAGRQASIKIDQDLSKPFNTITGAKGPLQKSTDIDKQIKAYGGEDFINRYVKNESYKKDISGKNLVENKDKFKKEDELYQGRRGSSADMAKILLQRQAQAQIIIGNLIGQKNQETPVYLQSFDEFKKYKNSIKNIDLNDNWPTDVMGVATNKPTLEIEEKKKKYYEAELAEYKKKNGSAPVALDPVDAYKQGQVQLDKIIDKKPSDITKEKLKASTITPDQKSLVSSYIKLNSFDKASRLTGKDLINLTDRYKSLVSEVEYETKDSSGKPIKGKKFEFTGSVDGIYDEQIKNRGQANDIGGDEDFIKASVDGEVNLIKLLGPNIFSKNIQKSILKNKDKNVLDTAAAIEQKMVGSFVKFGKGTLDKQTGMLNATFGKDPASVDISGALFESVIPPNLFDTDLKNIEVTKEDKMLSASQILQKQEGVQGGTKTLSRFNNLSFDYSAMDFNEKLLPQIENQGGLFKIISAKNKDGKWDRRSTEILVENSSTQKRFSELLQKSRGLTAAEGDIDPAGGAQGVADIDTFDPKGDPSKQIKQIQRENKRFKAIQAKEAKTTRRDIKNLNTIDKPSTNLDPKRGLTRDELQNSTTILRDGYPEFRKLVFENEAKKDISKNEKDLIKYDYASFSKGVDISSTKDVLLGKNVESLSGKINYNKTPEPTGNDAIPKEDDYKLTNLSYPYAEYYNNKDNVKNIVDEDFSTDDKMGGYSGKFKDFKNILAKVENFYKFGEVEDLEKPNFKTMEEFDKYKQGYQYKTNLMKNEVEFQSKSILGYIKNARERNSFTDKSIQDNNNLLTPQTTIEKLNSDTDENIRKIEEDKERLNPLKALKPLENLQNAPSFGATPEEIAAAKQEMDEAYASLMQDKLENPNFRNDQLSAYERSNQASSAYWDLVNPPMTLPNGGLERVPQFSYDYSNRPKPEEGPREKQERISTKTPEQISNEEIMNRPFTTGTIEGGAVLDNKGGIRIQGNQQQEEQRNIVENYLKSPTYRAIKIYQDSLDKIKLKQSFDSSASGVYENNENGELSDTLYLRALDNVIGKLKPQDAITEEYKKYIQLFREQIGQRLLNPTQQFVSGGAQFATKPEVSENKDDYLKGLPDGTYPAKPGDIGTPEASKNLEAMINVGKSDVGKKPKISSNQQYIDALYDEVRNAEIALSAKEDPADIIDYELDYYDIDADKKDFYEKNQYNSEAQDKYRNENDGKSKAITANESFIEITNRRNNALLSKNPKEASVYLEAKKKRDEFNRKIMDYIQKNDIKTGDNFSIDSLPPLYYKATGGSVPSYRANPNPSYFKPKGTDTVPAMLSPGEFVINASATAKHGDLLSAINSGQDVGYSATGGPVAYLKRGKSRKELQDNAGVDLKSLKPLGPNATRQERLAQRNAYRRLGVANQNERLQNESLAVEKNLIGNTEAQKDGDLLQQIGEGQKRVGDESGNSAREASIASLRQTGIGTTQISPGKDEEDNQKDEQQKQDKKEKKRKVMPLAPFNKPKNEKRFLNKGDDKKGTISPCYGCVETQTNNTVDTFSDAESCLSVMPSYNEGCGKPIVGGGGGGGGAGMAQPPTQSPGEIEQIKNKIERLYEEADQFSLELNNLSKGGMPKSPAKKLAKGGSVGYYSCGKNGGCGSTKTCSSCESGGPSLFNDGGLSLAPSDTIPAMLTPGEFVVNAKQSAKNSSLLHAINTGKEIEGFSDGGSVGYYAGGKSSGGTGASGRLSSAASKLSEAASELSNAASKISPDQTNINPIVNSRDPSSTVEIKGSSFDKLSQVLNSGFRLEELSSVLKTEIRINQSDISAMLGGMGTFGNSVGSFCTCVDKFSSSATNFNTNFVAALTNFNTYISDLKAAAALIPTTINVKGNINTNVSVGMDATTIQFAVQKVVQEVSDEMKRMINDAIDRTENGI